MTDNNLVKLPAVEVVCEALEKAGLKYSVYDKCRVEPTDKRQVQSATKINYLKCMNFCIQKYLEIVTTCKFSLGKYL